MPRERIVLLHLRHLVQAKSPFAAPISCCGSDVPSHTMASSVTVLKSLPCRSWGWSDLGYMGGLPQDSEPVPLPRSPQVLPLGGAGRRFSPNITVACWPRPPLYSTCSFTCWNGGCPTSNMDLLITPSTISFMAVAAQHREATHRVGAASRLGGGPCLEKALFPEQNYSARKSLRLPFSGSLGFSFYPEWSLSLSNVHEKWRWAS